MLAFLRNPFHSAECLEADGFCISVHAQAVNPGKTTLDKVVSIEISLAPAGNRTRVLWPVRDFHKAEAAGNRAGILSLSFTGIAVSDNTADILIPAEAALGAGVLDRSVA